MWLHTTEDEGIRTSEHICDTCGVLFSLCPAVASNDTAWDSCVAEGCDSYDPARNPTWEDLGL